jgi:DNA-binding transcriptional regulator YdaS (Cro superfamily)
MNTFATWVNAIGGATEAAELIGCTPDAVRKWMRGERTPRPQTAAKIEVVSGGKVPRSSLLWPLLNDQAA